MKPEMPADLAAASSPLKNDASVTHGMEDSLLSRVYLAAACAVAVIVLLAGYFLVVHWREAETGDLRDTTFEVLRVADRVETDLARVEAALRDFVVDGGGDAPLEQFYRRRAVLHDRLAHLTAIGTSEPLQAEAIASIRESLAFWESRIADRQIAARQAGSLDATLASDPTGPQLLEKIRLNLGNFSRRESDRWEAVRERADAERIRQAFGFGILSLVAIGLVIAGSRYGYWSTRRYLQKIADARAQFRQIVDHTQDALFTADPKGTILVANPAASRMFGVSEEEIVGHHVTDLFPHAGFERGISLLARGLVETEARHLIAPFTTVPVELSMSRMEINGQCEYVVLARDITERWRNEEALRQIGLGVSSTTGEEFVHGLVTRLSQTLDVACAFIVEIHEKGNASIITAERGRICRNSACDLAKTACDEVLREGYRVYRSGVHHRFPEDWLVGAFGAESFVCMPLVDHLGHYVGLLGVLDQHEMTRVDLIEATLQIFAARAAAELERKHFAESLAREKEKLDVTLNSIGDACIAVDNAGRILLFNPVAERLTGWKTADAIGASLQDILSLLSARSRRPLRKPIVALIETGSASEVAGSTVVLARDGSERIVETIASPLQGPDGAKVGAVLVLRDVTERHRTMEERQKAEKLESLGVAAGGIAHDFNNLLTAILGNLSLVLMKMRDDDGNYDRLASAKRASLRAQELAQQLLTFAKGGAPIKQTSSIGQLVNDTVKFHLRGSQVRLDLHIPEDLWPADVDAGQISQVIQNLTINADQAMPMGGTLQVTCANVELRHGGGRLGLEAGKYLKITVQDEGIGIPEEFLKKIFDPYFTTKPKGSGLGLATSYSIVKNHGGVIDVVSQPGQGTTFYIFLAASEGTVEAAHEDEAEAPPAPAKTRILVLDDEEAICALVTCALEPLGYEIVESYDAETAIEVFQQALSDGRRFDVIISDLTIPGSMSGKEAVAKMHELDPTVKAIVSSGYAMDPVMSSFKDYGFCAMIAKPYDIATLGRVVSEVVQHGEATKVIKHDFAA